MATGDGPEGIIQFQFHNDNLYVLDRNGRIWEKLSLTAKWKFVAGWQKND